MTRIVLRLWLPGAFLLTGGFAVADVEKWIDPDGGVHYGDRPPAGVDAVPVPVRPNVIETDQITQPIPAGERRAQPEPFVESTPAAVSAQRKDIQSYIELCRKNRGLDCEREARQMIDGPASVSFPGDPAVFPRPDVKPTPPGLPLKYGITP